MKKFLAIYVSFPMVIIVAIFSSCSSTRTLPEFDPSVVGKYERPCPDVPEFIDPRDSTVYQTIQVGDQCWMKENLRWLPDVASYRDKSNTDPRYYVFGYDGTDASEASKDPSYEYFGVLYNFPAALDACPPGWRLPTIDDWDDLANYLVDNYEEYNHKNIAVSLKSDIQKRPFWRTLSRDPHIWFQERGVDAETNEFGFSALPGGYLSGKKRKIFNTPRYNYKGNVSIWWSNNEYDSTMAYAKVLTAFSNEFQYCHDLKASGFSVRCLLENKKEADDDNIQTESSNYQGPYTESQTDNNGKESLNINMDTNICRIKRQTFNIKYYFGYSAGFSVIDFNVTPSGDLSEYGFSDISGGYGLGFHTGIMSNVRLSRNTNLRFSPAQCVFLNTSLQFKKNNDNQEIIKQEFDIVVFLEFPLTVKYTFTPTNIFSPYLIGGVNYKLISFVPAQSRIGHNHYVDLKPHDLSMDLGIGFQKYFHRFRLSAEIRASLGMINLASEGNVDPSFYNAIDRLSSRAFMISFLIE